LHVQDWSENQKESPEQCSGLEWKSEAQSRTSVIWPPVRRGSAKLFHGRQQHVGQPKTKENELSLAMFEGGNMALLQLRLVVHQEHSTGSVHQGLPVCHQALSLSRMMVFFCRASDSKMHKIAHEEDSWICKVECKESHWHSCQLGTKLVEFCNQVHQHSCFATHWDLLLLDDVINHGNATLSHGRWFENWCEVNGCWRLWILEPRLSENCCVHNNFLPFESWFRAKNDIKMPANLQICHCSKLMNFNHNLAVCSVSAFSIKNVRGWSLSFSRWNWKHLMDSHAQHAFCREMKMIVFDHQQLCTFLLLVELLLRQFLGCWVAANKDERKIATNDVFVSPTSSSCWHNNLKMQPLFSFLRLSDLAWQWGLRGSLVATILAFWLKMLKTANEN